MVIDLREKRGRKEAERKEGYENEKRRERTDEGETVSKVGVRRLQSLAVSMRISGRFSNLESICLMIFAKTKGKKKKKEKGESKWKTATAKPPGKFQHENERKWQQEQDCKIP